MNFEGFTASQLKYETRTKYNSNKENPTKIFRTSFKQNDKKTGKMSVKRLTKWANDMKKYYANSIKDSNVNITFKINGAGSGKMMAMKNFINARDKEEIKNIAEYFDDFDWYNNH